MAWTTTDLLADVRRRAMLPTTATQGTTDADLLEHANNELFSRLAPLVMSVNEEFYVQTVDIPIVSGQSAYRMPNRSAGAKLREVTYLIGSTRNQLTRLEPEQLTRWVVNPLGVPSAFYLEAGTLNLIPTPAGAGTIRMSYFVRPGRLTNTATDYATVGAVSYTGGNSVLTSLSGSLTAALSGVYDIIAFRPPFEYLLADAVCTSLAGGVTFTVSSPTTPAPNFSPNIAVGDYVTLRDKSPVLQLPVELHSLLSQRTVCAVMEAFNYTERLQAAEAVYARMEETALRLITPRVDGAPKKMRGLINTQGRFGVGWR